MQLRVAHLSNKVTARAPQVVDGVPRPPGTSWLWRCRTNRRCRRSALPSGRSASPPVHGLKPIQSSVAATGSRRLNVADSLPAHQAAHSAAKSDGRGRDRRWQFHLPARSVPGHGCLGCPIWSLVGAGLPHTCPWQQTTVVVRVADSVEGSVRAALFGRTSVVLTLMLGSAACAISSGDSATAPTGHGPSKPATVRDATDQMPDRATPGSTRRDGVDIKLPRNARVIVAPMRSHGDRTFTFDPRDDVFSSTFGCSGGGRVMVDLRGTGKSNSVRCDGVLGQYAFITDGSRQVLEIRAHSTVEWQVAVIEGDGPGIRVRTGRQHHYPRNRALTAADADA